MTQLAVILGSSRPKSNSTFLAQRAVARFPKGNIEIIELRKYRIEPIRDYRHEKQPWPEISGDYTFCLQSILAADALLIATPVYWYSMPGQLKNFIDGWSRTMRMDPFFKGRMMSKRLYLIATGAEEDHKKFMPLVETFQYIAEFLSMKFRKYLLATANLPEEVSQNRDILQEADLLLEEEKYYEPNSL